MNSGHIFMLIAFVAGALILTTEILPVKPRKHKVASVIILGVVLSGIDVASALYAARRERKAHAQSEALVASPTPTMTVTSSVSPSILSSPSPLKASSKAPAITTPRVSPNTKADERLVTEQSGVPIVTEQSGVPMTEEAETPWAIEVMVRPYGADEPLADANITIKNKRTNEQHSAVSGSDGHLALQLPVGEYKVTISKPGYRAVSRPCSITKKQGCYVVVGLEKE
jgi:hypothetical protein